MAHKIRGEKNTTTTGLHDARLPLLSTLSFFLFFFILSFYFLSSYFQPCEIDQVIWRGELWGSVHRSIRFEFFLDRQKHAVVLTAAIICIILFGGINNIRERDWRLPDDYRATKTYPFTECCNRKRGRVNFRVPFSCLMGGRSCKRWGSWSRHKPTRITTCTQPKPIPPASQGRRATERERKKLFFSFFFFIWNSRCKQMKTVFIESGGISYAATTLFGSQKKMGPADIENRARSFSACFFYFYYRSIEENASHLSMVPDTPFSVLTSFLFECF